MSSDDLILMMPWFVFMNRHHEDDFEYIFHRCECDIKLCYSLYFACNIYKTEYLMSPHIMEEVQHRLLEKIRPYWAEEIKLTESFVDALDIAMGEQDESKRIHLINRWFHNHKDGFNLPWNSNIRVIGVLKDNIKIMHSSSSPTIIPLLTQRGIVKILYKNEDVRSDLVSMVVAKWIQRLCGDVCDVYTYHVFPTTPLTGWIEIVDDATTLYDIIHEHKTNLLNFILEKNLNLTVSTLREYYIKSCVGACVLAWVMGLGDRHLENILVSHKNGCLFHIDFSYILGDDPKLIHQPIRLTADMVSALGGAGSETFDKFQRLCVEAFTIVRSYPRLWYTCLDLLTHIHASVSVTRIRNHVNQRFVPGEFDSQQASRVLDIVKTASGTSWANMAADWSHSTRNFLRSLIITPPTFKLE